MTLNISTRAAELGALESPLLVLALPSGATLPDGLEAADRATSGALRRLVERRDFRGGRALERETMFRHIPQLAMN